MTASGTKVSSKDTVSGKESRTTHTSESGLLPKLMAMVFTPGPMEIGMKANGKCASNMAKALTTSFPETSTQENTLMESHTERESTPGQMARSIQENSTRV